ncbi:MAG: lytic transglycosylase domain-containing protein [Ignavibacteriales bacterium]
MPRSHRGNSGFRFSLALWFFIILILITVFTFPKWITFFYPMPHKELVFHYAEEYEVDPYLIFSLIRVESHFQAEATSNSGARGLMQLMPDTARWSARQLGMKGFTEDQLSDPETNIKLGCWYVSDLSHEFRGRLPITIAAYNAGRGNVREWLVAGVWDGTEENLKQIPFPETRNHVQRVMNDYQIYQEIYKFSGDSP